MEILRFWLPPILVGLVVSISGVGAVEVAGLTPDPVEPPTRSAASPRPEVAPARIEVAPPDPDASAPAVEPPPARIVEMESEPESEPEREPEPAAEPPASPAPEPEPEVTAEVTPEAEAQPEPEPVPEPVSEPAPMDASAAPAPTTPGELIDLSPWKLTLPTGPSGHPQEVRQPTLGTFSDPAVFHLDATAQGVVFRARTGGTTTPNSDYPRSELREMNAGGSDEAGWSNAAGVHVMTITQAITATPPAKPHVVAGQVHDDEDDVLMIRLEGNRLFVEADGDDIGVLDANYQLGTTFTVEITATPAGFAVSYNGSVAASLRKVGKGLYFKAGCYTQSNPSKGDSPDAFGEVVIYALTVRHS